MNGLFLKNTAVVGALTFLSRISGFARDLFVAKYLGAGRLSDCFFVAFKIPNVFRAIFAEGAFNSAFVPIFSGIVHTEGKERAGEFARSIFALLCYMLLVFTLLAEVFMPWVVAVFAPGFEAEADKFALAVGLSRIMFPFLFFVSVSSFFGAILNSIGLFKPYALMPIVLNLVMVFSLMFCAILEPATAYVLSWSLWAAGAVQISYLGFIAYRRGFGVVSFGFEISPPVSRFFRRILPGLVSAGIYHINIMIGGIFASGTNGAVSWIYYADRLNQLPVGVIGVAVATVLLPSISKEMKLGRMNRMKKTFDDSIRLSSLLVIPCAAGLVALSYPLIRVFFERGAFSAADAFETARVLSVLCFSLPALVYVKLFANAFYARGDTKTPMIASLLALIVNVFLSVVLNRAFGYVGVVAAVSVSSWLGLAALYFESCRRGLVKVYRRTLSDIAKMALASVAMGWMV
ncbi:MAG: murein biosynthesis integral membrane protein MurJ, partial [Rickettsiales bacterium]|nr:murein biosynthesis integral membrane protein MurJ [Rickettsiales bacterium]